MPERLQDTDWSYGARRTLYVGPHGGPRRISIDTLQVIIDGLRAAVSAIATDLGLTAQDVGVVELVDLVDGSCGVVLEQKAGNVTHVPLAVLLDGVDAYLNGDSLPGILTERSTGAISGFFSTLRSIATNDYPVFIEPRRLSAKSPNGHGELKQVPPAVERVEPAEVTLERNITTGGGSSLPMTNEWVITFSGVLVRLDSANKRMWVQTTRGLASGKLNDALFKTADDDDSRWHNVTVVCVSGSPGIKHIREVLHVQPATTDAPEWKEVPMNEAAREISTVLERVDSFALLKAGWNSYDALPTVAGARQAAKGFLLLAASMFTADGRKLILPFATPLVDGRVQLEWEDEDLYLEFTFAANGAIEYLRMVGDDSVEETATRDRAIELVKWFHGRVSS